MMQKSQAARKNAKQDNTMLGRMQRAVDRIEEARQEMSEIQTVMQKAATDSKDALRVHETLSDGLQALQRMMDGDRRNEYERRGDNLAAAGDFIFGAVGQLERATELFADCCDEDGYACDDTHVPNMEEMSQMTQTARAWGTMLGRMQRDADRADRIEEADRCDDQLDKAFEAYEELMQNDLEYEMQAYEQPDHLDNKIDAYEEPDHLDNKLDAYEEHDNLDKTIEAYEEMMQYEMQRQCAN